MVILPSFFVGVITTTLGSLRDLPGRRLGPLIRALRRDTDPLFRRVGLDLDEV